MTTPLLAIGLLSKISSVARQTLQQVNQAAQGADETADRQKLPGSKPKFDLQNLFTSLDNDKSGALSKEELQQLPSKLPGSKLASALLSLQESGKGKAAGDDLQSQLFDKLDQDGDGKISTDEFNALPRSARSLVHELGAAGSGPNGAARLGASGIKPVDDVAASSVDRDRLNRAANVYSRTALPGG